MDTTDKAKYAVVTADIIESTSLSPSEMNAVLDHVDSEFKSEKRSNFWVARGDSFQWFIEKPETALKKALLLRAVVNLWNRPSANITSSPSTDVRISIGIGRVSLMRQNLSESTGHAFILSGRGLERLKSERHTLLAIETGDPPLDEEFILTTAMASAITSRWSYASAEVIYWYLKGFETQTEIARKIGIGQSSVQRRMEAMHMDVIEMFLGRFSKLISDL